MYVKYFKYRYNIFDNIIIVIIYLHRVYITCVTHLNESLKKSDNYELYLDYRNNHPIDYFHRMLPYMSFFCFSSKIKNNSKQKKIRKCFIGMCLLTVIREYKRSQTSDKPTWKKFDRGACEQITHPRI